MSAAIKLLDLIFGVIWSEKKEGRRSKTRPSHRLSLEGLEGRFCPSVLISREPLPDLQFSSAHPQPPGPPPPLVHYYFWEWIGGIGTTNDWDGESAGNVSNWKAQNNTTGAIPPPSDMGWMSAGSLWPGKSSNNQANVYVVFDSNAATKCIDNIATFSGTGFQALTEVVFSQGSIGTTPILEINNSCTLASTFLWQNPITVAIDFAGTASVLESNGTSTIDGGFTFSDAAGKFQIDTGTTTTWTGSSDSVTYSQIWIAGTLDDASTGTCKSYYASTVGSAAWDVYILSGLLKFDAANSDFFDNNNDNKGYILNSSGTADFADAAGGCDMPFENHGEADFESGFHFTFNNAVAGSSGTYGQSYYQWGAGSPTATTIISHGSELTAELGFEMASGILQVGDSAGDTGGTIDTSGGTSSNSIKFDAGTVDFTQDTNFVTLALNPGSTSLVSVAGSNAVTFKMKVSNNSNSCDEFNTTGQITFSGNFTVDFEWSGNMSTGRTWFLFNSTTMVFTLGYSSTTITFTKIGSGTNTNNYNFAYHNVPSNDLYLQSS